MELGFLFGFPFKKSKRFVCTFCIKIYFVTMELGFLFGFFFAPFASIAYSCKEV